MERQFRDFAFSKDATSLLPLIERYGFKHAAFLLDNKDLPKSDTVKVYSCKLVDPLKDKGFEKTIKQAAKDYDYVLALGGDIDLNKRLVRCKNLSVLVNPCNSRSVNVDTQLLTIAMENNVRLGLTLSSLLELTSFKRSLLLSKYAFLFKLLKRKKFNPLILSGASNELELRNPRDMASLAQALGVEEDAALGSLEFNRLLKEGERE